MPVKRKNEKKDMTFKELIRWLRLRHMLRRRYETDVFRAFKKQQITDCGLYLLTATILLALAMTGAGLYTPISETKPVPGAVLYGEECVRNPVLHSDDMTCTVTVRIGAGEAFLWDTPTVTVGDMIADIGYSCSPDDLINVPLDAVVEDGMQVNVICVTYEEAEEIVSVPYDTVYQDVQTIPKGKTVRVSYGTEGVARQVQKQRFENGVLVSAEVLSEEIEKAPVNEVLQRGIGGVVSGVDGSFAYSYYIDVTATAYGGYAETRYTYSGTVAKEGVIAVDPDVIPLGTKVYVKGSYGDYGVCSADDIGSGIKNYHIDIFMDATYEEMMEFGVRNMRVYILE